MSSGNDRLWNAVSIFFVIATVLAILYFIFRFFTGGQVEPQIVPTAMVLPTVTETPIPPTATETPLPSLTPIPSETQTAIPSSTARPTTTNTPTPLPSATITETLTITPTLDVTFTPTIIPSPTGPTPTVPPALPFAGPPQVQYTRNFANTAGCAWQGVGGQVMALGGGTFTTPLQVHVYNDLQDFPRVLTGTNSAYGASGFEVRVANAITRDTYFAQLETRNNIPISEPVQIDFPGDCEQNVAIVNFEQVRSLAP